MSFLHKVQLEEIDRITPIKKARKNPVRVGDYDPVSYNWKSVAPYILFSVVFILMFSRSIVLQLVRGSENEALSVGNSLRYSLIRAERGVIFDRSGKVIARNVPGFSVELNTVLCKEECESVVEKVSRLVNIDIVRIKEELNSGVTQITLASGLQRDEIIKVESRLSELSGVSTQVDPLRGYFSDEAFAHLVGFVGADKDADRFGKSGLEKVYDGILHGNPGSNVIQVNSSGTYFTQMAEKKPTSGKNITLYIDRDLQQVAYEAIKEAVERKKATGGAVVATDPYTGGILALVSYPSFNSNALSKGISLSEYTKLAEDSRKPFFNRVISATYPPGSTFKMVTSLAALEDGVINEETLVDCPSYINIGTYIFRDWYAGGRGPIDVKTALKYSCDTFYYTIAGGYGDQKGIGIASLAAMAKRLGFGKTLGIDLEGEVSGVFPDEKWKEEVIGEQWYLGDTYITAIGQGNILSTPLQVNFYTSFFANGGRIYKPRILKLVEGREEQEPEVLYEDYSHKNFIETIREGMKLASSTGGTAYPLFDFPQKHDGIVIAGKTGTAEFGNPVEEGGAKTHAWYTAFGPYEDPNIVITVFLEGGGGGSDDAAPVARKVLDEWFK